MNQFESTRRKAKTMRPMIAALAAAFIMGGALAGYAVYRVAGHHAETAGATTQTPQTLAADPAASPTPSPSATSPEAAVKAVEQVQEQQGGIDQRLAAAEQRLARLDLQAQAASGNAARAEGLLIAFAARRAIEKGAELGFLADQLRLRFGDAMPNAVATIITASRNPVTLDKLVARLEGLAPKLTESSDQPGFSRFREEIGQLFIFRRESAPSPQPQRRLDRARLFLESGRIDSAIAEVRNMPGAVEAKSWAADAERYGDALRALDLIETAAVLEPRRLRDGDGERITQPGIATE
ncbi:hypothetical protein [Qipengyuania marisflavi]|uniref:Inner membrane protein n=1 Tax=Qipengyuania marisflavi TaxID=2486356 RepID=A0A5S3PA75_9SPHN|nr:hypothetical protein [Qipengyuania marisflavi]TMM50414.1 hypothetical protein FEV51_04390 [Qipengyuania marisflavi]